MRWASTLGPSKTATRQALSELASNKSSALVMQQIEYCAGSWLALG